MNFAAIFESMNVNLIRQTMNDGTTFLPSSVSGLARSLWLIGDKHVTRKVLILFVSSQKDRLG
jgi:hypothetical protein